MNKQNKDNKQDKQICARKYQVRKKIREREKCNLFVLQVKIYFGIKEVQYTGHGQWN